MSIRKKLASFIFLMMSFLLLIGGLLFIGRPVVVGAFQQSLDSMNSLDAIRELKANVNRQRVSLNRYLLLDDTAELISFEEASRNAAQSLKSIKARKTGAEPGWYSSLSDLFNKTLDSANHVTVHYRRGNKVKAYDEATNIFEKLFAQVNVLEKEKSAEAQTMFERVQSLTQALESLVLVSLIVAFLAGVLLFRSLYRAVMNPLEKLRRGADEFGRGHWDYKIELAYENEFGRLARSFNTMAENVKQLQAQAIHMDRMSAVGQLAGGVAHELNNPLTAVLGQSQILLAKLQESDPSYAQIQKIEQAAIRCKKIVRGLLDFSRPSQSTFESIDLNSIVTATVDLCEADLKRGRVTVEKYFPSDLPNIEGNASELQQVFLNLLTNALHAMPRGGTLTVGAQVHSDAMTILDRRKGTTRKSPGPWVELSFKDTGVGIAKEHLPRVFEPFFTTKEIGKGTGLGLAVSLGIVQKHGGDLRVESSGLNKGSSFYLILPLRNSIGRHWEGA